jgi:hypothetical protein
MQFAAPSSHIRLLAAVAFSMLVGVIVPNTSTAQTPEGVVPVTGEPYHKIRFDNGRVRMYEISAPKGAATLMHEHRADSFNVFFRAAEITNEPYSGNPVVAKISAGQVGFASTAKGPYSHRVVVSGDASFHVIAMELMSPAAAASTAMPRSGPAFKVALENARGRVYRLALVPGESSDVFTRPSGTAVFAISAGRISESIKGSSTRLWDFDSGHFRWIDSIQTLSVKNEGTTSIELVEIEVF